MTGWSTDICGCFQNLPWCCITFFFPCITSYSVANKIGKQNLAITSAITFILVFLSDIISRVCAVSLRMRALEEDDPLELHEVENDGAFIGSLAFSIMTLALFIILPVIVSQIRGTMREQYGIAGDMISDCCLSCLCMGCCVLCQMKNHLEEADQGNISRV